MTDYTSEIDGHEVVGQQIRVAKAGDGLSEAMQIEGRELHVGTTVTVIIRGVVTKPKFVPDDPKDPDGDYRRVDTIEAETATIVENTTVDKIMRKHAAEVAELRARQKEEKEGLKRLPLDTAVDVEQAEEDGVTPDNVRDLRG